MSVKTAQEEFDFLKPDYYPPCLPEPVRYNLVYRDGILFGPEILALVESWHLNEAFSLLAESLHHYPEQQRILFGDALIAVAGDRNYFPGLRASMEKAIERSVKSDSVLTVAARGQRLTPSSLKGCDFMDRQYAEAAAGWKKIGRIVCFLTYSSLVYLPRVLDAYRDSERQILLGLSAVSMTGQSTNYYFMIPGRLSIGGIGEGEYILRGERLMEAGASFVPVPE